MASTQLSLLGTFPIELYQQIYQRLAQASQSSITYSIKETVWGRGPEPITDENRLRMKWEITELDPSGSWLIQIQQKPEPLRLSPEMLSRSIIDLLIAGDSKRGNGGGSKESNILSIGGDPVSMVSAMGYEKKFEFYSKGDRFRRGAVVIELYRLYESLDSNSIPLDSSSYIISLTNKITPRAPTTTTTSNNNSTSSTPVPIATIQELKLEGMERMREVVGLLKGLVDLHRVE